jgi:hypothetical protein
VAASCDIVEAEFSLKVTLHETGRIVPDTVDDKFTAINGTVKTSLFAPPTALTQSPKLTTSLPTSAIVATGFALAQVTPDERRLEAMPPRAILLCPLTTGSWTETFTNEVPPMSDTLNVRSTRSPMVTLERDVEGIDVVGMLSANDGRGTVIS